MYPEVIPSIEVESKRGLNKTQIEALKEVLKENAEENLGMPMVFTLAEAAKEWMQERNVESKGDGSAFERMQQRKQEIERVKLKEAQKQEEKERRQKETDAEIKKATRQVLVCITKEEFFKWRDEFEEEMKLSESDAVSKAGNGNTTRLTGKQIFHMGLQNGGASSVREAEMRISEQKENEEVAVDEDVFDGDDIDNLLEGLEDFTT